MYNITKNRNELLKDNLKNPLFHKGYTRILNAYHNGEKIDEEK
jgi:hypothetical protein